MQPYYPSTSPLPVQSALTEPQQPCAVPLAIINFRFKLTGKDFG